jgi:hypothetical protein
MHFSLHFSCPWIRIHKVIESGFNPDPQPCCFLTKSLLPIKIVSGGRKIIPGTDTAQKSLYYIIPVH